MIKRWSKALLSLWWRPWTSLFTHVCPQAQDKPWQAHRQLSWARVPWGCRTLTPLPPLPPSPLVTFTDHPGNWTPSLLAGRKREQGRDEQREKLRKKMARRRGTVSGKVSKWWIIFSLPEQKRSAQSDHSLSSFCSVYRLRFDVLTATMYFYICLYSHIHTLTCTHTHTHMRTHTHRCRAHWRISIEPATCKTGPHL